MNTLSVNPIPVSPDQLEALSRELVDVGDRLEALGSEYWFPVARAAALVNGLRHHMVSLPIEREGESHGAH